MAKLPSYAYPSYRYAFKYNPVPVKPSYYHEEYFRASLEYPSIVEEITKDRQLTMEKTMDTYNLDYAKSYTYKNAAAKAAVTAMAKITTPAVPTQRIAIIAKGVDTYGYKSSQSWSLDVPTNQVRQVAKLLWDDANVTSVSITN